MDDPASLPICVDASEADWARLLARVASGAHFVLTQHGMPVARLSAFPASPPPRVFGALRGQAAVTDVFFEPLPDAELAAWEGR